MAKQTEKFTDCCYKDHLGYVSYCDKTPLILCTYRTKFQPHAVTQVKEIHKIINRLHSVYDVLYTKFDQAFIRSYTDFV